MMLEHRHVVTCVLMIGEVGAPRGKAMTTTVTLALTDGRPDTINAAVHEYLTKWSTRPHEVLELRAVKLGGEAWADVEVAT
jgi:hypothetical protein